MRLRSTSILCLFYVVVVVVVVYSTSPNEQAEMPSHLPIGQVLTE